MKRVGVFVGDSHNLTFFRHILSDLQAHYHVDVFQAPSVRWPVFRERLNRRLFSRAMLALLDKADLCFFEWASDLLVYASHLPKRCRLVARLHSYELFVWAPRVNWDNVDKVILVSAAMQRRFSELYPAHAAKTVVVYNGVNLERFRPRCARRFGFDIGVLAGIHPVKRIYELVLTTHSLRQRGYEPHLHIAGDKVPGGYFDDYYRAIEEARCRLDLEKHVTLHGQIEEVEDWFNEIDIFVSNSYWEGQQNALIEASASGCLCLSHFWGGADEAVLPDSVYATEEQLQAQLIRLAEMSDEARARRRQQTRALAEARFDRVRQTCELRRCVNETLAG
jgi:glycosyltransferase involved in cell wall biosynthesis